MRPAAPRLPQPAAAAERVWRPAQATWNRKKPSVLKRIQRHTRLDGVETYMSNTCRALIFSLALALPLFASAQAQVDPSSQQGAPDMRNESQQLFALANQARAQAGVGRLEWDPALAGAALYHCRRMAFEGPIAHRYNGEPDLADRASQSGARFGVIEENVAVGPSAEGIHEEWMNSP